MHRRKRCRGHIHQEATSWTRCPILTCFTYPNSFNHVPMTSNHALLPRVTCSHAHNPTQDKKWAVTTLMELRTKHQNNEGPKPTFDMIRNLGIAADRWDDRTKTNSVGPYTNSGNHGILFLRKPTSSATSSPTPTPTKSESHCACYCYCQR